MTVKMMNKIVDSEVSGKAKLYENIRCVDSIVSDDVVIGDDCDIVGGY